MIIKGKTVFVYDIEVFPNVFSCIVKNTETKEYYYFRIQVQAPKRRLHWDDLQDL